MKKWIFRISIVLNIIFCIGWLFYSLNTPSYKLGILNEDIKAGFLGNDSTIFIIPKGVTVRNVSPRGIEAIGQFENNRFEIIFTTDRDDLIDYSVPRKKMSEFGNYYSADKIPGTAR